MDWCCRKPDFASMADRDKIDQGLRNADRHLHGSLGKHIKSKAVCPYQKFHHAPANARREI